MKFDDIWGWFDYASLYKAAVDRMPNNAKMVEVGCFMGRSTAYLGQLIKDTPDDKVITLFAVDNWEGAPLDNMDEQYRKFIAEGKSGYDRFVENMGACGLLQGLSSRPIPGKILIPVQLPSVEAAKQFADNSLDFCFIDADHTFDSVCADIRAWFPKMKSGSWFAGHDYDRKDVIRAVHSTLADIGSAKNPVTSSPDWPTCWLYEVP